MASNCEPTGCFREEQRSRRVRSAPQDRPYLTFTTTQTTTTVTTTPPITEDIADLLQYVLIPNSGSNILCPTIQTTKPPMYFNAFGGNEKIVTNNLIVHKFYNDGVFSIVPYPNQNFDYAEINFLLVAGGGGGGAFDGGGGGGGGQVKFSSYKFPAGSYDIVIGSGGLTGLNGKDTSIPKIGIKTNGGGGGGSAFTNNAKTGGNGGGAGGRSNSLGAIGLGGNNGGASIGNVGGGGGGGAGERGQSVPTVENGISLNAGRGGDGAIITYDGGLTYNAYGGGGAGDPFTNQIVQPSVGGGGGTNNKNGVANTGGGGAGNGGMGGKGVCIISYVPVTTPPPTTTTTIAPRVPSKVQSLNRINLFQAVTLRWIAPSDSGTSNITHYKIEVKLNDVTQNTLTIPLGQLSTVNIDNVLYYTYTVENLTNQQNYLFLVSAKNNVGFGQTEQINGIPITTTTTTLSPSFVRFDFDFLNRRLEYATLDQEQQTIYAPENSSRSVKLSIYSSGNYVFYNAPLISTFGVDATYIEEESATVVISSDRKRVDYDIPFIMPPKPQSIATIGFTGSATETTTTTATTTTVTTIPPLCSSIYNSAPFTVTNGRDVQPILTQRLLNPLQIFFATKPFPTEITGTTSQTLIISGKPWYNGVYFEIGRNSDDSLTYINSLASNHNLKLYVKENTYFDVTTYKLFYPNVVINEIGQSYTFNVLGSTIEMSITLDYICNMNNVNIYGKAGSESISGFTSFKFSQYITQNNKENIFSKLITDFMFRDVGAVTALNGQTYYYMIDFGTRDKIVGV
jgi:hypothetical protein